MEPECDEDVVRLEGLAVSEVEGGLGDLARGKGGRGNLGVEGVLDAELLELLLDGCRDGRLQDGEEGGPGVGELW